ncbi:MAG: ABC transporter ATP-binding protein [Enterococcus lacertideformus]|uniref:ABC transporter ATP-binding protein n=1 Tax=Enterococcus lacertideformus TaxID=2771493 RepID=A0A931AZF6_9ENTE|nr:ABC transporter ATP-binding protein [Enterococcus lacertideformus]
MINLVYITKKFDNKIIFQDINLEISIGEVIGIVAPNGYGKTVLLDIITRKIIPDKGRILEKYNSNTRVFYDVQKDTFPEKWTVKDLVDFYASVYAIKIDKNQLDGLLNRYSLLEFKKKYATKLSGGQQRKLMMVIINLVSPDLLIMDEPTAGVDTRSCALFRQDLGKLKKSVTTIVLTSHNLEDMAHVCTRVVFIGNNQIAIDCNEINLDGIKSRYDSLYQEEL